MIAAVLFDLDDTLYPQESWLRGAWAAVASAGARCGLDAVTFEAALREVAAEGSDRGRIIDRALERVGAAGARVDPLVAAFKAHRPAVLEPYEGVPEALAALRAEVPLGLVTDGDVDIQEGKLDALGLRGAFDVVVLSDALGRDRRKPHPAPFEQALAALGVRAGDALFIGDRPDKDVRGARRAGIPAIRVRTGEYAARPDEPGAPPLATARGVTEAIAVARSFLPAAVLHLQR